MSAIDTCSLCPRLCRPSCPVAVSSGREAAVPALIAEVLRAASAGRVSGDLARSAASLCVDCGRCQDHCHLHIPLPEALRAARRQVGDPVPRPQLDLRSAPWMVCDDAERPWASALGARLGTDVGYLRGLRSIPSHWLETPELAPTAARIREACAGRQVVVADGDSAVNLRVLGVSFIWLHDHLGVPAQGSCCAGGSGCCGGGRPLVEHHPATAARMRARYEVEDVLADSRCAAWLSAGGRAVKDVVDTLLGGAS